MFVGICINSNHLSENWTKFHIIHSRCRYVISARCSSQLFVCRFISLRMPRDCHWALLIVNLMLSTNSSTALLLHICTSSLRLSGDFSHNITTKWCRILSINIIVNAVRYYNKHSFFEAQALRFPVHQISWIIDWVGEYTIFLYFPAVWNSLCRTVLESTSLTVVKSRLKTHLFHLAHNNGQ